MLKKKSTKILLIVVGVLIIVAAGFLIWGQRASADGVNPTSIVPTKYYTINQTFIVNNKANNAPVKNATILLNNGKIGLPTASCDDRTGVTDTTGRALFSKNIGTGIIAWASQLSGFQKATCSYTLTIIPPIPYNTPDKIVTKTDQRWSGYPRDGATLAPITVQLDLPVAMEKTVTLTNDAANPTANGTVVKLNWTVSGFGTGSTCNATGTNNTGWTGAKTAANGSAQIAATYVGSGATSTSTYILTCTDPAAPTAPKSATTQVVVLKPTTTNGTMMGRIMIWNSVAKAYKVNALPGTLTIQYPQNGVIKKQTQRVTGTYIFSLPSGPYGASISLVLDNNKGSFSSFMTMPNPVVPRDLFFGGVSISGL